MAPSANSCPAGPRRHAKGFLGAEFEFLLAAASFGIALVVVGLFAIRPPWRGLRAGVPLRALLFAAAAGLGAWGKNGCLLHPEHGSWVFLGEIVTDLTGLPPRAAEGLVYAVSAGVEIERLKRSLST